MSRAEALILALVSALASGAIAPYLLDALGLGIAPTLTALVMLSTAVVTFITVPARSNGTTDLFVVIALASTTAGWLVWRARPDALPPGSGPDLTHHLLLADYIQRHGTLVHDPNAAAALGEMAQYTPGLHALSAVTAALLRTDAIVTIYPIVVAAVALKFAVVALIVLRLVGDHPARRLWALAAVALLFSVPAYSFGAFVHDSFLAQVAAESFSLTMWWALVAWSAQPRWWPIGVYALCGAATFLTWPVWVGPPIAALVLIAALRRDLAVRQRFTQAAVAIVPAATLAAAHIFSRAAGLGLAGTSGAISLPPLSPIAWCFVLLAIVGLALSAKAKPPQPLLLFAAALTLQTAALWVVAWQRGATTPYMALKMTYLAVYVVTAAAVVALATMSRSRVWAAAVVTGLLAFAVRESWATPAPAPVVRRDLWLAGEWTRGHAAPGCVDYLVANEYTAYWLHLAVLGNARSVARSTDQATYDTQASFSRWLTDDGGPPFAIARASLLPAEIRDRFPVVFRSGDAVVLSRPTPCATP